MYVFLYTHTYKHTPQYSLYSIKISPDSGFITDFQEHLSKHFNSLAESCTENKSSELCQAI